MRSMPTHLVVLYLVYSVVVSVWTNRWYVLITQPETIHLYTCIVSFNSRRKTNLPVAVPLHLDVRARAASL